MLDLRQFTRLCICCARKASFAVICCFSLLHSVEYQDGLETLPRSCEHEWVARYFNSLDDQTSVEEVVDFLVSLKSALEAKGYRVPPLTELCLNVREYLLENGVEIEDADIEEIYNEFLKREGRLVKENMFLPALNQSLQHRLVEIKKIKKEKKRESPAPLKPREPLISDGIKKGFMKTIGGALLCIIPHPVAWGVGGVLMADGVREMIKNVGHQKASNESIEEKEKTSTTSLQ